MEKSKQLSLAQALSDLSGTEIEKLIGRKVLFIYESRSRRAGGRLKSEHKGTIIGLHNVPGYVLIRDDSGGLHSREPSQIWEAL